jgi:pimeloyl-ACP methyl ester carboxylesterase
MSRAGKIVLTVVGLLVLALLGTILYVWMRPLAFFASLERRALEKAGFVPSVMKSPSGPMTVWEAGQGPVIVLLHGAGDQAGAWSVVAPQLAGKYRVLIPDLPGHHESAPQEGPLPLGTVLAGVTALVEQKTGGQPVVLVGNSLGAWLAMLYARDHPGRVSRVVAVNGGPLRGRQDVSLMPRDREEARKLMALLRDPGTPPAPDFVLDDVVRYARVGPIGRLLADVPDMERYLLDGRLADFPTPVDLVWGESDRLMSMDYARNVESQLPAARLTAVARCGHVPMRECPTGLTTAIERVLNQPPPEMRAPPEPQPASRKR